MCSRRSVRGARPPTQTHYRPCTLRASASGDGLPAWQLRTACMMRSAVARAAGSLPTLTPDSRWQKRTSDMMCATSTAPPPALLASAPAPIMLLLQLAPGVIRAFEGGSSMAAFAGLAAATLVGAGAIRGLSLPGVLDQSLCCAGCRELLIGRSSGGTCRASARRELG